MLFINACVRADSRTKRIADAYIEKQSTSVTEMRLLEQEFPVVDEAYLKMRDELIFLGEFDNPMFDLARQFAEADHILIAAPFWDLSFPAALKQYMELINVVGITFVYTEEGLPKGLCKAEKLTYVTTAGGEFVPEEYGFGYIKSLAQNFYGIKDVELIKAVGLDIVGAEADRIIEETIRKL